MAAALHVAVNLPGIRGRISAAELRSRMHCLQGRVPMESGLAWKRRSLRAKRDDSEEAARSMKRALEHEPRRAAEMLASSLDSAGRKAVITALSASEKSDETDVSPMTTKETLVLTFKAAIGMVGFGFIDNSIMIIAGDAIQSSIGDTFGLSTMASAGLGNAVSDLLGSLLCGYIERVSEKFMPELDLTSSQLRSSSAQWAETVGAASGVTFGCILGLLPLLFISDSGPGGSHSIASTSYCDGASGTKHGKGQSTTTFASMSEGFRAPWPCELKHTRCGLCLMVSVSLFMIVKRMNEFLSKRT